MTFLFPAAFFLAVTAPIAVMLYLRRPLRRKQKVSSLFFWQRVLEREPRHRLLGRLRNPLSLLMALAILLLLLLALAKPEETRPPGKQHTVVLFDLRARMQAGDTFANALQEARQAVAGAGPDEEIALLGVAGSPRIISPFSTDASDLRERLDAQAPTDGGGSLDETLQLGRRLLASREGAKKILFITDRLVPNLDEVDVIATGLSRENAAILEFAQRPLPASPQSAEILVKVGNFAKEARDLEFELAIDGRPIDLQTLRVDAGRQADFSTLLPAETLRDSEGLLTARLTGSDSLAVDDSARAVFPTGGRLRVLLLTDGNPYLENALRADAGIALEMLSPDIWRQGMGAGFDAVIWDNTLLEHTSLSSLGQGNYFFFGASPYSSETGMRPSNVEQMQSPLLWNVDFSRVQFSPARKMTIPKEEGARPHVALQSADGPLLMAVAGPDGSRAVAAAFDVAGSTLPSRAGFPLFINNVVHWLAGTPLADKNGRRAGETMMPPAGTEIARAPKSAGTSQFDPSPLFLAKNGFYEVRNAEGTNWLAVNTSNAEESDLRSSAQTGTFLRTVARFAGLMPWQWLAMGALALLIAEWAMHHRRITE